MQISLSTWKAEPHLTLQESPRKTLLLNSKGAREWLAWISVTQLGKAAGDTTLKTALTGLSGIACHSGGEAIPVYLRAAPSPDDNGYYIDLCDEQWRAIHVTASGWRIVDEPPVRFRRSQTMQPLPIPKPGGRIEPLWRAINVTKPEDRHILLAFIVEAWRPDTPFPVLELFGGQGSGKSDTQDRVRAVTDPNAVPLRSIPKDVEAIHVSANSNWIISYNNLSRLSSPMQDAFCNLATGGGYAVRALYTNKDESLIESKRPVMLNGINPVATAQDLIDWTIRIELEPIKHRRRAAELEAEFEAARPEIFGGLLDLFSQVLSILPTVEIADPPRMADFGQLGQAVYQALGVKGDFNADYRARRARAIELGIDASPVAAAVRELADEAGDFEGTVKELLDVLTDYKHGEANWPRSPKGLSDILHRHAPALASVGVKITFDPKRHKDGHHVRIEKDPPPARAVMREPRPLLARRMEDVRL